MRRTFNATSIETGRITGRTRRQRKVEMSLSQGEISNSKRMGGSMINKNGGQTINFI